MKEKMLSNEAYWTLVAAHITWRNLLFQVNMSLFNMRGFVCSTNNVTRMLLPVAFTEEDTSLILKSPVGCVLVPYFPNYAVPKKHFYSLKTRTLFHLYGLKSNYANVMQRMESMINLAMQDECRFIKNSEIIVVDHYKWANLSHLPLREKVYLFIRRSIQKPKLMKDMVLGKYNKATLRTLSMLDICKTEMQTKKSNPNLLRLRHFIIDDLKINVFALAAFIEDIRDIFILPAAFSGLMNLSPAMKREKKAVLTRYLMRGGLVAQYPNFTDYFDDTDYAITCTIPEMQELAVSLRVLWTTHSIQSKEFVSLCTLIFNILAYTGPCSVPLEENIMTSDSVQANYLRMAFQTRSAFEGLGC